MDTDTISQGSVSNDNELFQLREFVATLQNQAEDLKLHLEVANERWVEQVNKNAELEVALRKMRRNTNG